MEAFSDGYKSGLKGCDPRLCPYDKLTKEWDEWQRGHGIGARAVDGVDDERRLRMFAEGAGAEDVKRIAILVAIVAVIAFAVGAWLF